MSGKFGLPSGKCQGILFCQVCMNPDYVCAGLCSAVGNLTADTCLAADPGVTSLILAWSHTFVEIDYEIISTAIHLPSADSRRVAKVCARYTG